MVNKAIISKSKRTININLSKGVFSIALNAFKNTKTMLKIPPKEAI
jgi:hypothetical protein